MNAEGEHPTPLLDLLTCAIVRFRTRYEKAPLRSENFVHGSKCALSDRVPSHSLGPAYHHKGPASTLSVLCFCLFLALTAVVDNGIVEPQWLMTIRSVLVNASTCFLASTTELPNHDSHFAVQATANS